MVPKMLLSYADGQLSDGKNMVILGHNAAATRPIVYWQLNYFVFEQTTKANIFVRFLFIPAGM